MKNNLDLIEQALKLKKEAIELANSAMNSNKDVDSETKKDISNLMASFLSGNDLLAEDVANNMMKDLKERLKKQDANNTK